MFRNYIAFVGSKNFKLNFNLQQFCFGFRTNLAIILKSNKAVFVVKTIQTTLGLISLSFIEYIVMRWFDKKYLKYKLTIFN